MEKAAPVKAPFSKDLLFVPYVNSSFNESEGVDERRACIFEIGSADNWMFQLAQLELRLAVFLCKRRLKMNNGALRLDSVVAAGGVYIPRQYHQTCHEVLALGDLGETMPCIAELLGQGMIHVLPETIDQIEPQQFLAPPCTFVLYEGSTYKLVPAANNVASLKSVLKLQCRIEQGPLPLLVMTHNGTLLGDVDPLLPTSKETPYMVTRQEIWVSYEGCTYKLVPAENSVASLKSALKLQCRIEQGPLPLLVVTHNGTLLGDVDPLVPTSKETPYMVTQQEIWVSYEDELIKIVPDSCTVDSMIDALKVKRWIAEGPLQLLVAAHGGTLLDTCAPLLPTSKETPYMVTQQEIWVSFEGCTYKLVPAENSVASLKSALKAQWESDNDGKLNSGRLIVSYKDVMEGGSARLHSVTEDAPYVVVLDHRVTSNR